MSEENKDAVLDIILRTAEMEPDDSVALDYAGLGLETHPAARAVYQLRQKLLDEYAKQGDARGALGPIWFWVDNEWKCDVHEMYVYQRNDEAGAPFWCFGYVGCEEIADVDGPRAGMRAAEEWARTHPEEAPEALLPSVTFTQKEVTVMRRVMQGDVANGLRSTKGAIESGMTSGEAQAFCAKLGL